MLLCRQWNSSARQDADDLGSWSLEQHVQVFGGTFQTEFMFRWLLHGQTPHCRHPLEPSVLLTCRSRCCTPAGSEHVVFPRAHANSPNHMHLQLSRHMGHHVSARRCTWPRHGNAQLLLLMRGCEHVCCPVQHLRLLPRHEQAQRCFIIRVRGWSTRHSTTAPAIAIQSVKQASYTCHSMQHATYPASQCPVARCKNWTARRRPTAQLHG